MSAASAQCSRCKRNTATPFRGTAVCLHCAGVRALALDLDDEVDSLDPTAAITVAPSRDRSGLPERIGPYEIVDELGRGGMARVFAARQPRLDRLVALKVLGTGPSNEALEQRFLREIQTVARLRHPHIVAIHDSGRADGYVYFAMDYIEGGDFAQRLRVHPLPARTIAVLLEKIAAALAYAHGEGVLHRDLKPSNILLDGDEPRLADFGLAAQMEAGGDLTVASAVLGTPHYLAPEAVKSGSAALSAASDLYALGVILYEAIAGRTPFAGASSAELPALLQNSEPPPLRLLAPGTPRDLETICLKCLERDPARRYASTAAFAADLRHFLAGESIVAQPPGALQRFRRFSRKHRMLLAVTGGTGAALAAGIAVSTALAIRATRAEKRAAREAAAATAVVEFVREDLLSKASLEEQPDPDLRMRTVLDRASRNIERRFVAQPEIESPIRDVLGVTYASLGDYTLAHLHLTRALKLAQEQYGPDDLKTLAVENRLADTLIYLGRNAEAMPVKRRLLDRYRQRLGDDDRLTLMASRDLAATLLQSAKFSEAEPILRDTAARAERVLGPEHPVTIATLYSLGTLLFQTGRTNEAKPILTTGLARARKVFGIERELTLITMVMLAGLYGRADDIDGAAALLNEALPAARRGAGPEHPATLRVMHALAVAEIARHHPAEAAAILNEVVAIRRRVLGPEHSLTTQSESMLIACQFEQGRFEDASKLASQVLEKRRRLSGPEHPDTLRAMELFAETLAGLHKYDEAAAEHARTLALRQKVLGRTHTDTLLTWRNLGDDWLMAGNAAAAESTLRDALAAHREVPARKWLIAMVETRLGVALVRLGRSTEAEPLLTSSYAVLFQEREKIPAMNRKVVAEAASYLAEFHASAGRPLQAAEWRAIAEGKGK